MTPQEATPTQVIQAKALNPLPRYIRRKQLHDAIQAGKAPWQAGYDEGFAQGTRQGMQIGYNEGYAHAMKDLTPVAQPPPGPPTLIQPVSIRDRLVEAPQGAEGLRA